MTVALAIDTASEPRSRGYAIADGGVVRWRGKKPADAPRALLAYVETVAGEHPWHGGALRGARLVTFCVNNGYQLRSAATWAPNASLTVNIPVLVWKGLALPGCERMPGDVFCRNLAERYCPGETDDDVVDACGIAVAASLLTLQQLKKYQPKGFR